jgi:hypothetical protein
MNKSLPSDLLKLKAQFESWRRTREKKGPIPDHLRKAAIALLDEYAARTICTELRHQVANKNISRCARIY